MKAFHITAGQINSIYTGKDENEALDNYAYDAGYSLYSNLVTEVGEVDRIEEVDARKLEREYNEAQEASDFDKLEKLGDHYGVDHDQLMEIINLELNK